MYPNPIHWFLAHDLKFQVVFSFTFFLLSLAAGIIVAVQMNRNKRREEHFKAVSFMEEVEGQLLELMFAAEDPEEEEYQNSVEELKQRIRNEENIAHYYRLIADFLINYRVNILGESGGQIEQLFRDLDLHKITLENLKTGEWHNKIKALTLLGEFNIREYLFEILVYVDNKEKLVREEAQFNAIKLGGLKAAKFVSDIQRPISPWQQIRLLEETLKHESTIAPLALQWIQNKNHTIVELGLRICNSLQIFDAAEFVPELLSHNKEGVRSLAIDLIERLFLVDQVPSLIRMLQVEDEAIKAKIIRVVGELGDWEEYGTLLEHTFRFETYPQAFAAAQGIILLNGPEKLQSMAEHLEPFRMRIIEDLTHA